MKRVLVARECVMEVVAWLVKEGEGACVCLLRCVNPQQEE